MREKNYYQILQIPQGTSAGVIEAAYWDLARRYGAHLETDPEAAYLIEELNEAYRVLATPDLRHQYDLSLANSVGAPKPRRRRFLWFGRPKSESRSKSPVPQEGTAVVATQHDLPSPAQDVTTHAPVGLAPTPSEEGTKSTSLEAVPPPSGEGDPRPTAEGSGWLRWEMPPLQSFVVSVGLVVVLVMALVAGANPGLTLILGSVTVFFALFPWRFGRLPAAPLALERPERHREEDDQKAQVLAQVLHDSTAALVARWREGMSGEPGAGGESPPADRSSSSSNQDTL